MKHFKIIDFDAKKVHEFDIKDNEMLDWDVLELVKDYYKVMDKKMNKTATNYDRFRARKMDLI